MKKIFEDFLDDIQSDELTSKSDDLTAHSRLLFEDGVELYFSMNEDKVKREDSKAFREISAKIERVLERHRHIIHDAGSLNGLFVNGERMSDACLLPGDEIGLGNTLLRYEVI